MPKLKEKKIESFSEYSLFIDERVIANGRSFWYRGVDSSSHPLLPRLYRPSQQKREVPELLAVEVEMDDWFRNRSIPFCAREPKPGWDCLFLMQHYGMPTRLLDWTENPYMALYFALAPIISLKKGEKKPTNSAVWLLEPRLWNLGATSDIGGKEEIFFTSDKYGLLDHYQVNKISPDRKNPPLALHGAHNSPRIVAQRGVFTVFGSTMISMERYYEGTESSFNENSLMQVIIPNDKSERIFGSLISSGITESVVFPDLDGLASEACRIFGFRK